MAKNHHLATESDPAASGRSSEAYFLTRTCVFFGMREPCFLLFIFLCEVIKGVPRSTDWLIFMVHIYKYAHAERGFRDNYIKMVAESEAHEWLVFLMAFAGFEIPCTPLSPTYQSSQLLTPRDLTRITIDERK